MKIDDIKIRISEIIEREKHLENLTEFENALCHWSACQVATEILEFIELLEKK